MSSRDPVFTGEHRIRWLAQASRLLAQRGLAAEAIFAALRAENLAKCDSPLDEIELRAQVTAALEFASVEEGHRAAAYRRLLRAPRLSVVDDVGIEKIPPIQWLVDKFIPQTGRVLMFGPPGIGKSYVALDIAFSVATGVDWQGMSVRRGDVVFIAGEGYAGLPARVRAWKKEHGFEGLAGVQFVSGPVHVLEVAHVEEFIERFCGTKTALVVLDTVARCMVGGDEDTAKDMGLLVEAVDQIGNALDCAVLLNHHPTKDGRAERGSGALRGAVDTVIRLKKSTDSITLSCEKQKDAEPFKDIQVRLKTVPLEGAVGCVVTPSDIRETTSALDARHRSLLAALARAPKPLSLDELRAELPNIKERTLFRLLKALEDEGYLADRVGQKGVYRLSARGTATAKQLP